MAKQSRSWSWRHAIVKSDLPPTTRHVLLTISVFMNDAGDGCYPTTKQLAEATGLSERAVCEHIARASSSGWLSISVHGFKGQKWKNHQYEAAWPEVEGTDPDDKKALTEGQSTTPVTTPITNSMSERGSDVSAPKGKKQVYPEAFEAFWRDYPRTPNMSKLKALAGWKRLTLPEQVDCHRAVPLYLDFLASKPDHPKMHASTFINERRFEGFNEQATNSAPSRVVTDADWQKRLKYGRDNRQWHVEAWGPFPGAPDCRVPEHLLQPSDGQDWAVWEA